MKLAPDSIVMHHSATVDQDSLDWQAIRRFHTSWRCNGTIVAPQAVNDLMAAGRYVEKPWTDIGYHFGIDKVGGRYEILVGRLPDVQGAHCHTAGYNRRSLGVCCIGNFDQRQVPDQQWQRAVELVRFLMELYRIPATKVCGHREIASYKSCPGNLFDMNRFRQDICAR